jgi:hypothetical protein
MQKRYAPFLALSLIACSEDPPPPPPNPVAVKTTPASQPASAPASVPVKALPKVEVGPRVLEIKGTVLVDGAPAYEGLALTETSVIETKAASTALVTVMSGGVLNVRELARVELGKNADWKKAKKKEWSIKVLAGALWSFLPKGSSYEVQAPNAVAGARGTTFYVQVNAPDDSYICVCDGDVEVQSAGKKKMHKSKHKHLSMTFKGADKKTKVKPTKERIGHTDAEGDAINKLLADVK